MTTKTKIIIGVLLVIAGAVAYYFYDKKKKEKAVTAPVIKTVPAGTVAVNSTPPPVADTTSGSRVKFVGA